MKGMAFKKTPQSKPRSFEGPMLFYRLAGIFGASGKKSAAMADERTDRRLIKADEK
jgi:hypothetical protein